MTEDGSRGPPPQRARQRLAPDKRIITPDDEPSALERGARIIERLARKPDRD